MKLNQHIQIEQLVAFCVFMENGEGIQSKAPDYIWEKFRFCLDTVEIEYLEGQLDNSNKAKFQQWQNTWNPGNLGIAKEG